MCSEFTKRFRKLGGAHEVFYVTSRSTGFGQGKMLEGFSDSLISSQGVNIEIFPFPPGRLPHGNHGQASNKTITDDEANL